MANHSNANILVVEDDSQLKKILAVKDELPGKFEGFENRDCCEKFDTVSY